MSSPPPRSRRSARSVRPGRDPGPGLVARVLVGLALLAFYGVLAAGSVVVFTSLWQGGLDPGVVVLGIGVGTLVAAYLSLRLGTQRILSQLDARELSEARAPAVHRLLADLADAMEIDRPRLLVARLGEPNAFALATRGRGTVVVAASLFELLDGGEIEALLAHELAHLERRDSLVQTAVLSVSQLVVVLVEVLLSPVVFLVTGIALSLAWFRGAPRSWPETVPGRIRRRLESGVVLVGVAVTLLLRAHARRREFAADRRAAEVTGRPRALASALRKLDRASKPAAVGRSPLWHGEVESDAERRLREYFSTHPPTKERIERLADIAADSATRIPVE
ncbi:M48 family metallopeptidase [Halobellus ordinarius]|uniref:M48 family metallopeptidase n=1 Tax=Halobellus ordinarius TaxID=3075120 RepID=UPI00288093C6|nr:M48 family metalloprotease [Halobellus sp. ZY16]